LQIVKKYKQPVLIFKSVEEKIMTLQEDDRFDWQEIFKLFHKAKVKDENFKFQGIDEEKIKEILVKKHDFSDERIEKQLERLREGKEKGNQRNLKKWF
jgi:hypothetical protein